MHISWYPAHLTFFGISIIHTIWPCNNQKDGMKWTSFRQTKPQNEMNAIFAKWKQTDQIGAITKGCKSQLQSKQLERGNYPCWIVSLVNPNLPMYHPISANNHPHTVSNEKQLTSVSVSYPPYPEARSNSPQHPRQWSWSPILDPPQGCSSTTACWWCIPPVPWVYL